MIDLHQGMTRVGTCVGHNRPYFQRKARHKCFHGTDLSFNRGELSPPRDSNAIQPKTVSSNARIMRNTPATTDPEQKGMHSTVMMRAVVRVTYFPITSHSSYTSSKRTSSSAMVSSRGRRKTRWSPPMSSPPPGAGVWSDGP